MKKTLVIAGAAALCAAALSGCVSTSANQWATIAQNVAAVAPQACTDLQMITGDLSQFAGQVSAANSNNATVQKVVGKINNGVPLLNSDCKALAALAPSVAAGATLGVTIGGQIK